MCTRVPYPLEREISLSLSREHIEVWIPLLESEKRGRTRNSKIRSKGRAMAVAVDGDSKMKEARKWASRRREAIEAAEMARAERRAREVEEERRMVVARDVQGRGGGDGGAKAADRTEAMRAGGGNADEWERNDAQGHEEHAVVWDGRFGAAPDDSVGRMLPWEAEAAKTKDVQHGRRATTTTHGPTSSGSSTGGSVSSSGSSGGSTHVVDAACVIDDFVRSSSELHPHQLQQQHNNHHRRQPQGRRRGDPSASTVEGGEEVTSSCSSSSCSSTSSISSGATVGGPRRTRRKWAAAASPLHEAASKSAGGSNRVMERSASPTSSANSGPDRCARRELLKGSRPAPAPAPAPAAMQTTASRIMALLRECDERTAREQSGDPSRKNNRARRPASSPPKFVPRTVASQPPPPVPLAYMRRSSEYPLQHLQQQQQQHEHHVPRQQQQQPQPRPEQQQQQQQQEVRPPKQEQRQQQVQPQPTKMRQPRARHVVVQDRSLTDKKKASSAKTLAPSKPQLARGDVNISAGGVNVDQPWRKARRSRPEDVVTRQMFDKRHSRRNFSEPFQAAIARWRDSFPNGMRNTHGFDVSSSVRVYVRKRPLFQHEQSRGEYDCVTVPTNEHGSQEVVVHNCQMHADLKRMYIKHQSFLVSGSFHEHVNNDEVYTNAASGIVQHACAGGTSALFMYGQTGSGKTYTMAAIEREAAEAIFAFAGAADVRLSYFEICGKRCVDLLGSGDITLKEIGESVELIGAACEHVASADQLIGILEQGKARRATSSTFANASSSRSHAVVRLRIGQETKSKSRGGGTLMLIDCAGSERKEDNMYHNAEQRKETAEINTSLYALKECMRMRQIQASSGGRHQHVHVPYRSSQLTRVLMECFLRTDSAIAVIGTVSPSASDIEHSVSTLKTVQLIGGGEIDDGIIEKKEDVPRGLKFDENGMVVLDEKHKEIPVVQWKHASVERFIWRACKGRFAGAHVPLALDGRALVRMTPSSLCEGICGGDLKAANDLYNAVRDEVARISKSRQAI